ncbi:hypothetical protein NC651_005324 [Populus alba x Populus x berolinensis]|nr:hypothetical protein NC651_005324 [Populus alba x Populus x berolinensis]
MREGYADRDDSENTKRDRTERISLREDVREPCEGVSFAHWKATKQREREQKTTSIRLKPGLLQLGSSGGLPPRPNVKERREGRMWEGYRNGDQFHKNLA